MIQNYNLSQILKKALSQGGDFAEIFFEKSVFNQVVAEEKRIEKVVSGVDMGAGIRVLSKGQTAYGYTNDISEAGLLKLASTVSDAVAGTYFSHDIQLITQKPHWTNSVKILPFTIPTEKKVQAVLQASQKAWSFAPEVQQVIAAYRDHARQIVVANSKGDLSSDDQNYTQFLVQVIARKDDNLQTGYEPVGGTMGYELLDEISPEQVAEIAAKQALLMLRARKAPAGKCL